MKSFLSLFYTAPAKITFSLLLFIVSLLIGECQSRYYIFYVEDNESFVNAITQIDSFDYETSHYFKNTVENTIENITKLSMEYEDVFEQEISTEALLNHYHSIGDKGFIQIYENLSSIKNIRFALVNHNRHKIYSNISKINGTDSFNDVRRYFGETDRTLLIARSCKNPYFETAAFIEYAEYIRDCAEKYEDNFDLYISFGTEENFSENEAKYEQMHFSMRRRIEKVNDTVLLLTAILVFIIAILFNVTGKQEHKGKTYPTVMNRLPNDLILIIYGIILICQISLYNTSADMIITHGNELDELWFTHSMDFYVERIKLSIAIFVCVGTNLICILKRQYKMGTLLENTYIGSYIKSIKGNKTDSNDG